MKWFFIVLSSEATPQENAPLFLELRVQHAKMVQDNVWLLKVKYKVRTQEVFDTLKEYLRPTDRLLVIESVDSAWYNLMLNPLSQAG